MRPSQDQEAMDLAYGIPPSGAGPVGDAAGLSLSGEPQRY